MKKLVIAYLNQNLGDDLFLRILCDRYNEEFITQSTQKYKKELLPPNLKIYDGIKTKILYKIGCKLFENSDFTYEILKKKCDLMVSIGGSIFIESRKFDPQKNYLVYNSKIPYYIIGANFGPYKTEGFYNFIKMKVIAKSKDTCFRDEYSYNNFSELDNVRYASDIVFTLDTSNLEFKNEKRVIISVIDYSNRGGVMKQKNSMKKK